VVLAELGVASASVSVVVLAGLGVASELVEVVVLAELGVAAGVVEAPGAGAPVGAIAGLADVIGICRTLASTGMGRGASMTGWLAPAAQVAIAAAVRSFATTPVGVSQDLCKG
jgi:hypothetical protein